MLISSGWSTAAHKKKKLKYEPYILKKKSIFLLQIGSGYIPLSTVPDVCILAGEKKKELKKKKNRKN